MVLRLAVTLGHDPPRFFEAEVGSVGADAARVALGVAADEFLRTFKREMGTRGAAWRERDWRRAKRARHENRPTP